MDTVISDTPNKQLCSQFCVIVKAKFLQFKLADRLPYNGNSCFVIYTTFQILNSCSHKYNPIVLNFNSYTQRNSFSW